MLSLADAVRRFWRRLLGTGPEPAARRRRLVPVVISVLALTGATTGVVLATVGGKPAEVTGLSAPVPQFPQSSPAPTRSTGPVVPMLGGNADGSGTPLAVPVAPTTASPSGSPSSGRGVTPASKTPASTTPAGPGPASTTPAGTPPASTAPASTASPGAGSPSASP